MRSFHRVAVVLAVLLLLPAGVAWAGFVDGSVSVVLAEAGGEYGGAPPWAGAPSFVFDLLPDESGNGQLVLDELFGGSDSLAHVISGITDVDPVMNVQKEINNDSGSAWAGFTLALPDGGDITFTGPATSDQLTLVSQDDYNVVFGAPGQVELGETMVLDFSVLIPSTGPFSFTLTQTPVVPEPSTLALLGMGGLALLAFRRRK